MLSQSIRLIGATAWVATLSATAIAGEQPASPFPEVTQHQVVPVMLRHCNVCHGLRRQEGGLDLRSKASMLRGGDSGPAIVLGNSDESLLIKKIRAGEMPPKKELLNTGTRPIAEGDVSRLVQ